MAPPQGQRKTMNMNMSASFHNTNQKEEPTTTDDEHMDVASPQSQMEDDQYISPH